MRIPRLAAPIAACVVASLTLALPATAAAGGGSGSTATPTTGPVQRVLLGLTPTDRQALKTLARNGSTRRAAPAAALHRALPSASRRESVAATAESLGLTVERTTTMAVLVSGRASLVESLFG